jgi:hypothetical protein
MKITKKHQKLIISELYLIIDINRVGSDEIDFIENILEGFENLKVKELTKDKLVEVRNQVIDLKNWSDRLGSDENGIINDIIKLIDNLV